MEESTCFLFTHSNINYHPRVLFLFFFFHLLKIGVATVFQKFVCEELHLQNSMGGLFSRNRVPVGLTVIVQRIVDWLQLSWWIISSVSSKTASVIAALYFRARNTKNQNYLQTPEASDNLGENFPKTDQFTVSCYDRIQVTFKNEFSYYVLLFPTSCCPGSHVWWTTAWHERPHICRKQQRDSETAPLVKNQESFHRSAPFFKIYIYIFAVWKYSSMICDWFGQT